MIPDLNISAVPSRLLTLSNREFTVNDSPAAERFMVSLSPFTSTKPNDGSPRDRQPSVIRWRAGPLGPGPFFKAGDRINLSRLLSLRPYENTVYELLSNPTEFRTAGITQGVQANVCSVNDLYPVSGSLVDQKTDGAEDIIVALWDDRENQQPTGNYKELSGEAPVEFTDALALPNRSILVGEQRYRVIGPITDYEGPRVKFTARLSYA